MTWVYRFLDWLRDVPVLAQLWLADRILGPEPPTLADLIREQQHESLHRPGASNPLLPEE